jgi:hypothetical protein
MSLRARAPALLRLLGRQAQLQQQQVQAAAASLVARRSFADDASLKKTVLYDFHTRLGGPSTELCSRPSTLARVALLRRAPETTPKQRDR